MLGLRSTRIGRLGLCLRLWRCYPTLPCALRCHGSTQNAKEYVGITIGRLEGRLRQHFASARRGRKSAFTNAIKKYGEAAFSIQLIRGDARSFAELQDQEIAEIHSRDCIRHGYNTAVGGSLGSSKSINVNGKTFPSRGQAAEFFGVDPTVFNLRLERLKWTPEEAAGVVEKSWKAKPEPVEVHGVKYKSFSAACRALGAKVTVARHLWSTKGVPIEEAMVIASQAADGGTKESEPDGYER